MSCSSCQSCAVYAVGQKAKLQGVFTELNDENDLYEAVDPDVVYLSVRYPDLTLETFTFESGGDMLNPSTGVYTQEVDLDQSGTYYYRWWSTGNVQASNESSFDAEPVQAI